MNWVLRYTKLRDIGFRLWDPFGFMYSHNDWEGSGFEGEYDRYLLRVAAMLRKQEHAKDAEHYLVDIEANHMGLDVNSTTKLRAKNTIQAIMECDQLWIK